MREVLSDLLDIAVFSEAVGGKVVFVCAAGQSSSFFDANSSHSSNWFSAIRHASARVNSEEGAEQSIKPGEAVEETSLSARVDDALAHPADFACPAIEQAERQLAHRIAGFLEEEPPAPGGPVLGPWGAPGVRAPLLPPA